MSHDHDHSHSHGHEHHHSEHDHQHSHGHSHEAKDPAEQAELAQHLGEELTALFVRYVRGELDFAEVSFSAYDVLQDLHVIALGEYELEYGEDEAELDYEAASGPEAGSGDAPEPGDTASDYDPATATEQQEDLAQEPSRS